MNKNVKAIRELLNLNQHEFNIKEHKGGGYTPAVNTKVCVRLSESKAFKGWEQAIVAGYIKGVLMQMQACVVYTERGDIVSYEFVAVSRLMEFRNVVERDRAAESVNGRVNRPLHKFKPKPGQKPKAKKSKLPVPVLMLQVIECVTRDVISNRDKDQSLTYVFRRFADSVLVSVEGRGYVKAAIYKPTGSDKWAAEIYINVADDDEAPVVFRYPQYRFESDKLSGATPGDAFAAVSRIIEQQVAISDVSSTLRAGEDCWLNGSKFIRVFGAACDIATLDTENDFPLPWGTK